MVSIVERKGREAGLTSHQKAQKFWLTSSLA